MPIKHVPQLDGLRAIAVLMVFAHHALQIRLLWNGVDLFFILSGYLITQILLRDRERYTFASVMRQFYTRRAERILPAYLIMMALMVVFTTQDWRHLWPYYAGFAQNIPASNGMIPAGPLVPLWSLAVEQQFYLVWPVVVLLLPKKWLVPCMAAMLVLVPALRAACTPFFHDELPIYMLTPFRVDTLAAGALIALLQSHWKPQRAIRVSQVVMIAAAGTYFLLALHPWFRRTSNVVSFNTFAYSLDILVFGGLFVWVLLARESWIVRLLCTPALRYLGRISYMFYLLQGWVVILCESHLPRRVGAPLAFVITLTLAHLSWIAVERPILGLGARFRERREPVAVPA